MAINNYVGQIGQFTVRDCLQNYQIPSLPEVVFRCLKCARDEKSSVAELATLIKTDKGIVGELFKRANCADMGSHAINNAGKAIRDLGMKRVTALILASCVETNLRHVNPKNISVKDFWRYSLFIGCATSAVCVKYEIMTEADPFAVGVLCSVGELVILDRIDSQLASDMMDKDTVEERMELEESHLGFNHQQLSFTIMKEWHLSTEYMNASISCYNPPTTAPKTLYDALCTAIHIVRLDAIECPKYWRGLDSHNAKYLSKEIIEEIHGPADKDMNMYCALMGL